MGGVSGPDWVPSPVLLAAFDEAEWARVEAAYAGRLLSYVSRRLVDQEEREDVVQETFLGAVRGIGNFNTAYTFEQFLFGICRNRTVDQLRRRDARGYGSGGEGSVEGLELASIARDDRTPSQIIRRTDLADRGRDLLAAALQEWVELTWAAGEMTRLMVVEGLLRGGMRNRDLWKPLGLRDEVSVAGIKFRALKKIRELLLAREGAEEIAASLDGLSADADAPMDVQSVWVSRRASCPSRRWIARWLAGGLEPGAARFMAFHLDDLGCDWCEANRDDLARERKGGHGDVMDAVQGSSIRWLRSRTT